MTGHRLITVNTILYCKKWEETVAFYRDRLCLPAIFSCDWFVEFSLNPMSRLSIADEARATIKGCGGRGITITLEVTDIDAVHAMAETAGINPTRPTHHPWGAKVFYLFDPEGHRIEIWKSLDENSAVSEPGAGPL